MKKYILLLGMSLIVGCTINKSDVVRIGTEGAYAPWNYFDDSGKLAGFDIDLGRELCRRAELNCEMVVNEWDSIIPNLLAGNYDMIMAGMNITEERRQTINFSEEYFPLSPSRYITTAARTFDFNRLKGLKIGVQGATIQADYAAEVLGAENKLLSFETPEQAIADLMAGNIDLLLDDSTFLEPVVDGSSGSLVFAGEALAIGGAVGIGMRQDNTKLQAQIATALTAAKADGTVDKLIAKYFEKGPFYSNE